MFPCSGKHIFHSECIQKWLKSTCPYCRHDLLSIPADNIYGDGKNICIKMPKTEI